MKWMIASDLHGSATFCQAMLRRFQEENADRLLLLGDLLYHGPRNDLPEGYAPKEVIAQLNAVRERLLCIRGNCDAEVDQMVLQFPILAEYAVLPYQDRLIYASHGHIWNPQHLPPLCGGDVFLFGHTHIPFCEKVGGVLCLNPGSVSLPKQDSPRSYMTFQSGTFEWKALDTGATYRTALL